MSNFSINVTFTDKQQKIYKEWQEHIKAIYGEYGSYSHTFHSDGIGMHISVYSHKTKTTLELTDFDDF